MSKFGYFNNPAIGHNNIITQLVRMTGCEKYLELGVYDGFNISKVKEFCPRCIGVDIHDKRTNFNYDFKLTTTDKFFQDNAETFDIIFIDADHNVESVKKDFINSLKMLNKFGIILIHDTDPISEEYTQPEYCGDSYKIIDWVIDNYPELNLITLPITEAGLTIVNRKNDRRTLK